MGIAKSWQKLFGHSAPRLASVSGSTEQVNVDKLEIRTAEAMVIVTISPNTVPLLAQISSTGDSLTLISEGPDHSGPVGHTVVSFSFSKHAELPVKDPRRGWKISLTPEELKKISNLKPRQGDYELSPRMAIVVE